MAVAAAHYLEILDKEGYRVDGESEGLEHEGQIDVTSWNWDVSDKSAAKSGASTNVASRGGVAGPTKASTDGTEEVGIDPSLFTFTKPVDAATTRLMKALNGGEVLKRVTFELLEEMVGAKNERLDAFRLRVVLERVTVASYRLGGRANEHRVDLDETWELNYTTISFHYESAGGMNAVFQRNPASTKRAASKSEGDDKQQMQKKIADLEQSIAAAKGKRG
jgi:type VI protein secretion system component Hcp